MRSRSIRESKVIVKPASPLADIKKNPFAGLTPAQRHAAQAQLIAKGITAPARTSCIVIAKKDLDAAGIRQDHLFTEPEVARFFQISQITLYRMRKEGKIIHFNIGTAKKPIIRYWLPDLMAFLESVKVEALPGVAETKQGEKA